MSMNDKLSSEEKETLLNVARQSLELGLRGKKLPRLETDSPLLQADGATFVTLTVNGKLRGCIGALEPYQPLINDVREHALAAAQKDFRFNPVRPEELDQIEIEISRLTKPVPLEYDDALDLLKKLRPGVDGVVIKDGQRRATFLPQVWEQLPDPKVFLSELCAKMGVPSNAWQRKKLDVLVYQVEEFCEGRE